eukprot:TRINITY_DN38652_c0_g1_i1.p1 TRINITY_DN38652_c0_g1~~TRINITY_DN38652_c0_g1_i1.p1  ORF type:complete len:558 (-),score=111.08 TRINITY_DN38652_c0_g1_i1:68-1690(-)
MAKDSGFTQLYHHLLALHNDEVASLRKEIETLASRAISESQLSQKDAEHCEVKSEPRNENGQGGTPVVLADSRTMSTINLDLAAGDEDEGVIDVNELVDVDEASEKAEASQKRFHHISLSLPKVPTSRRTLGVFIYSPFFEIVMSVLIFVNGIVFALEAQYAGMEFGVEIAYYDKSFYPNWPGCPEAFVVIEWTLGLLFTIEVCLRLFASGPKFVKDCWNIMDAFIVAIWILGKAWEGVPINTQVLRMSRVVRLLRLLRLVRKIHQFDALYLITTAIRGVGEILGWTTAVLLLCQMLFALLMNQFLSSFYFNADAPDMDSQREVYEYFGTFSRSVLTLFEMTLANWPPVCRLLTENVSEWLMLFSLAHKLTMGLAVVGVMNGVLLQETFKVAQSDDVIMLRAKQKQMKVHSQKMNKLIGHADSSNDGTLDWDEFKAVIEDHDLKAWLSAQDFDVHDAKEVFELLDVHGTGALTTEQVVRGVAQYKGAARSLDLNRNMHHQGELLNRILVAVQRLHTPSMARQLSNDQQPSTMSPGLEWSI